MSPAPEAPSPTPPARRRKRVLVPAALAGLFGVFFAWHAVRGTWADDAPRVPRSSAEGVVAHLYRTPAGRRLVRGAVVIDRPVDDVWRVITDYERFGDLFPRVSAVAARPDGPDRVRLECVVATPVGSLPVAVRVAHGRDGAARTASWDESAGGTDFGSLRVNRGAWTLTAPEPGKTLAVYTLDVEVHPFPSFFVRSLLLGEAPAILAAVRAQAAPGSTAP